MRSKQLQAALRSAVEQELDRRFPAEHAALTRVRLHSNSNCCTETTPWSQFTTLAYAEVFAPGQEYYEGSDAAEAATLAKLKAQKGEAGVRVPEHIAYRWAHRLRDRRNNLSDELLEHDCRFKMDKDSGQCYIVWDPKYAKRMRTRASNTGRGGSSPTYIQVYEFWNCIRGLRDKIRKAYCLDYGELGHRNSSRYFMLNRFEDALKWICQAYGRYAYRHVEEWQKFMAIWKERGEATWKNFRRKEASRRYGGDDNYQGLFEFFDAELKARKPRAANWDKMLDQRTYGLPGQLNEEGFLRTYDQAKLKQKYPDAYKELQKDHAHQQRKLKKKERAA